MSNRFTVPTKIDLPQDSSEITVIILASGLVYRRKTYGPPLLSVTSQKKTILDSHMSCINEVLPNSEVIITVGFEANKIINKKPKHVRIVENQLFETTNEAEEIRLALNCCTTDNVLIIQDDFIFDYEVLSQAVTKHSSVTITNNSGFDKCAGVIINNDTISNFSYGLKDNVAGLYYFTGKELKALKNICSKREDSFKLLIEIMNEIVDKNGTNLKPVFLEKGRIEKI